jgi:AraC-like DNA-binding protein
MNELIALIDSLLSGPVTQNGKSPLRHLGLISCGNSVHIKHVPFYDPCIIVVLCGRKVVFDARGPVICEAGSAIAVPAPASFDLRNEPDMRRGLYRALVIPFKHEHLERLRRAHDIGHIGQCENIGVLNFGRDELFVSSIKHYLESPSESLIADHRLIEILLILVQKDARLMSFILNQGSWSQKVRSILSNDLGYEWTLAGVCHRLGTSESTLRRQLQREGTGFRELLYELRLSTALMQLLQTSAPVYQIAYQCGYQSVSRFTSNFRKRFGLPPTAIRASVGEMEQILTVTEHSVSS